MKAPKWKNEHILHNSGKLRREEMLPGVTEQVMEQRRKVVKNKAGDRREQGQFGYSPKP